MRIRVLRTVACTLAAVVLGTGVATSAAHADGGGPRQPGSAAADTLTTFDLPAPSADDLAAQTSTADSLPVSSTTTSATDQAAPAASNSAVHFNGWPTVGAIFDGPVYDRNGHRTSTYHTCSGSVVSSPHGNLVMTAAHCAYQHRFLAFAPGYINDRFPYGIWYVKQVKVASGWIKNHDPSEDFAFLVMLPYQGKNIQQYTGSVYPAVSSLPATVSVDGYNEPWHRNGDKWVGDHDGNRQIICTTRAVKYSSTQELFRCGPFMDGSSGSPWIVAGTRRVIGVIGGKDRGGKSDAYSYSSLFTGTTMRLYHQAES